jgi:hypothetical protein
MIGPKTIIVVASGAFSADELRGLGADLILETRDAALLMRHLVHAITEPVPPYLRRSERAERGGP